MSRDGGATRREKREEVLSEIEADGVKLRDIK